MPPVRNSRCTARQGHERSESPADGRHNNWRRQQRPYPVGIGSDRHRGGEQPQLRHIDRRPAATAGHSFDDGDQRRRYDMQLERRQSQWTAGPPRRGGRQADSSVRRRSPSRDDERRMESRRRHVWTGPQRHENVGHENSDRTMAAEPVDVGYRDPALRRHRGRSVSLSPPRCQRNHGDDIDISDEEEEEKTADDGEQLQEPTTEYYCNAVDPAAEEYYDDDDPAEYYEYYIDEAGEPMERYRCCYDPAEDEN